MGVDQSYQGIISARARVVVIAKRNGDINCLTELSKIPQDCRILGTGLTVQELEEDGNMYTEGNVLLNISGARDNLNEIIGKMPFLKWVHTTSAGVDSVLCEALLQQQDVILTNSKGIYNDMLAEYVLGSCWYFAKDVPRLLEQKREKQWNRFHVQPIKGKTMGIIGYGSIGASVAKLAKCYGMKILALRRNPQLCRGDKNIDEVCSTLFVHLQSEIILRLSIIGF